MKNKQKDKLKDIEEKKDKSLTQQELMILKPKLKSMGFGEKES